MARHRRNGGRRGIDDDGLGGGGAADGLQGIVAGSQRGARVVVGPDAAAVGGYGGAETACAAQGEGDAGICRGRAGEDQGLVAGDEVAEDAGVAGDAVDGYGAGLVVDGRSGVAVAVAGVVGVGGGGGDSAVNHTAQVERRQLPSAAALHDGGIGDGGGAVGQGDGQRAALGNIGGGALDDHAVVLGGSHRAVVDARPVEIVGDGDGRRVGDDGHVSGRGGVVAGSVAARRGHRVGVAGNVAARTHIGCQAGVDGPGAALLHDHIVVGENVAVAVTAAAGVDGDGNDASRRQVGGAGDQR